MKCIVSTIGRLLLIFWPIATIGFSQAPHPYTIPDGTRIQALLETPLSTKTSHQGDRFVTRVHETILLNGKEVIPKGTVIEGRVAAVKRPNHGRSRAEMNLAYERMILPNGVSFTIVATQADMDDSLKAEIDRKEGTIKGESTNKRDAAEVGGGAAAGAGVGAIAGGGRGGNWSRCWRSSRADRFNATEGKGYQITSRYSVSLALGSPLNDSIHALTLHFWFMRIFIFYVFVAIDSLFFIDYLIVVIGFFFGNQAHFT